MILGGLWLVDRFSWIFYLFGAYLGWSGIQLLRGEDDDEEPDPEASSFVRLAKKLIPIASGNHGGKFVVRPGSNRRNRWFWGEPTTPLRSPTWARTLKQIPSEGFYTLPDTLEFEGGGRWLKNAVVELGYDDQGRAIVFVGQWREDGTDNVLYFSARGMIVDDKVLARLTWAPILPITGEIT